MSLASVKNRQFAGAIALIVVLAVAAALLGPLLIDALVGQLYHSDAPLWQGVFRQREALGPEAYQSKVLDYFRLAAILGFSLVAALAYVLWDNAGDRFSLQAISWPRLNARTLGVVGTAALALLSIRGTLPYLAPLACGLVTLLARDESRPFIRLNRFYEWVLSKRISIPLVIVLAVVTFFVKFRPADLNKLVFFDDYPTIYTTTIKGWEMLKQGGIFGWDPAMMGGYYTVADVSHDEIFFMLPFLAFGPKIAFHMMILFFYVLFPILIYAYARIRFGLDKPAVLAMWIGLFTAFGFFDNLLYWGMVNSFIGLDLMLINLILFAWMRQGKRYASLGLIVAIPLTLYAAGGFFVYSLLLIGIDLLWHFEWKLVPRLSFVMVAAFFISLTYAYSLVRYPGFFIQSDEIYAPQAYTLGQMVSQSIQALPGVLKPSLWLLGVPVRYQGAFLVSLPILGAVVWSVSRRQKKASSSRSVVLEFAFMAALIMLGSLIESPTLDMFVSRVRFVLPVLLGFLYAAWLTQDEQLHPAPLLIVLTLLLTTLPSRLLEPIPHEASLAAYNPALIQQIEGLDSKLLLLESMGAYNLATEGSGTTQLQATHVHMESYFPLETDKHYMANNQEGYHHSVYRRNFITSGAFRGKLLPDWPAEEIEGFLSQWGVKYLVLWSQISKGYFGANPAFRQLWDDGHWAIYEYAAAQPGDAILAHGQAALEANSYYEQTVHLRDVQAGDLIQLRMNYFPAWRASLDGQPVELLDRDGQLAFTAPRDGTYDVALKYPRYSGLSALALGTLLVSFFAVRRFKGAL